MSKEGSSDGELLIGAVVCLGTRLILAFPVTTLPSDGPDRNRHCLSDRHAARLSQNQPHGSARSGKATTISCGPPTSKSSAMRTTRSSSSKAPDATRWCPSSKSCRRSLREERLFHAVLHEVEPWQGPFQGPALPAARVNSIGIRGFLTELGPIVRAVLPTSTPWSVSTSAAWPPALLQQMQAAGNDPRRPDAAATRSRGWPKASAPALGQRGRYQSPWPEMPSSFAILSELNSEYLLTKQGQLGFVLLRLARGDDSFDHCTEACVALRELIAQSQARHPDVKIGLTGLPVMENDEMLSSKTSMLWASMVSMVARRAAVRRRLRRRAACAAWPTRFCWSGMALAFGYATLRRRASEHSQRHVYRHADRHRHRLRRLLRRALLASVAATNQDPHTRAARNRLAIGGPAITTGAITTADRVLRGRPDQLHRRGGTGHHRRRRHSALRHRPACSCCRPCIQLVDRSGWGVRMPEAAGACIAWIAPLLQSAAADAGRDAWRPPRSSATGLEPAAVRQQPAQHAGRGLESVELERKLLDECNQSVWYALSMADSREELLARKEKFLQLASVERTEEIVSLLPVDDEVKRPIDRAHSASSWRASAGTPAADHGRLDPKTLGAGARPDASCWPVARVTTRSARQSRDQFATRCGGCRPPDCYALLSRFQQEMAGDLLSRLAHSADDGQPRAAGKLTDLPASLVDRFVGQHGKHLLKIYGRGDIWDTMALRRFVNDVRTRRSARHRQSAASPRSFAGNEDELPGSRALCAAGDHGRAGARLQESARWRAWPRCRWHRHLADVRAARLAQHSAQPGQPDRAAAHHGPGRGLRRAHPARVPRNEGPYRMSPGTAVAVLVDALTTLVGFGSLMIATHQGLQSLGRVLTLGVTCCLFTSLIMLPAAATWFTRNRKAPVVEEPRVLIEPACCHGVCRCGDFWKRHSAVQRTRVPPASASAVFLAAPPGKVQPPLHSRTGGASGTRGGAQGFDLHELLLLARPVPLSSASR